jgi:crotonobetainyl-CoA:carnitine CoA-transferase CaiB-like acyl-CoA transferase
VYTPLFRERLGVRMSTNPVSTAHLNGPLSGIRVLDLSSYIAGPYGCALLADLGAEIVKVEPREGDGLRHYPSTLEAESRAFLGVNRSKRGIVLDLKHADGRSALMRLVSHADVVVHSFRPGVPSRLGIDYETLKTVNPRLIYCALTGYGESGPMKDKAGYDQVLQCFTGLSAFQGGSAGSPEIMLGSVVDFYAASLIAQGVSAALFCRERTGEGQYVGLSLLGAALAMQSGRFVWADSEGPDANRDLRSGGITGIHPTKAGNLYISANTPHFWRALCTLTGLPELAENAEYDTVRKRARRAAAIVPVIQRALKARTALEWEAVFGEEVPCCAVRPIEEMFDHPQVLAEGLVTTVNNPRTGKYRGLRKPLKFSATRGPEPFGAPSLGQHTDDVLSGIGYTSEELADLRLRGVIGD